MAVPFVSLWAKLPPRWRRTIAQGATLWAVAFVTTLAATGGRSFGLGAIVGAAVAGLRVVWEHFLPSLPVPFSQRKNV